MRTLLASLVLLSAIGFQPSSLAAPDAELTQLLAANAVTSEKIVDYADQKAAALVAAQAEAAQLRQQLAAAQAQVATLTAERDAARKAVADAKATVQSAQTALQAAAAKL